MPAVPEQLLGAPIRASAHRVLVALWARAQVDGVAFVAATVRDLQRLLGMPRRTVIDALVELRTAGLATRARRAFAGGLVRGWELSRVVLRAPGRRAAPATPASRPATVADSEKRRTIEDDMKAIARVAGRGDGERAIADRLVARKIPCSEGQWHHIKVHRRIEAMRRALGSGAGERAGEVAHRWRLARGT